MVDQNIQIKAVNIKKSRDNGSCANNTKSKYKYKEINLSTIDSWLPQTFNIKFIATIVNSFIHSFIQDINAYFKKQSSAGILQNRLYLQIS